VLVTCRQYKVSDLACIPSTHTYMHPVAVIAWLLCWLPLLSCHPQPLLLLLLLLVHLCVCSQCVCRCTPLLTLLVTTVRWLGATPTCMWRLT
jgi:hypothetical protein